MSKSTDDNPKWPTHVKLKPGRSLELDGVEFPWYITEDGVTVQPGSRGELTTITVTMPCDYVEIEPQN